MQARLDALAAAKKSAEAAAPTPAVALKKSPVKPAAAPVAAAPAPEPVAAAAPVVSYGAAVPGSHSYEDLKVRHTA